MENDYVDKINKYLNIITKFDSWYDFQFETLTKIPITKMLNNEVMLEWLDLVDIEEVNEEGVLKNLKNCNLIPKERYDEDFC